MNNNQIQSKKSKINPAETIRNYKVNRNNEDDNDDEQYQNQSEDDQLSDEDQEDQDIADMHQWKEKYNQLRHELFDHNQINILKLLSLNKTTKLKHKIVIMSSEEEENNYDRSRERELIFKKIKSLRLEMRIYKENKRSKKLKPEQLEENLTILEKKFDDLKLEQMNIFNEMESERIQIEDIIKRMDDRINQYDELSDSDYDENNNNNNFNTNIKQNNQKNNVFINNKDRNKLGNQDNTLKKGIKNNTNNNNKQVNLIQKQNSLANLYEVNEVAEEYNDANESLLTKNEIAYPSSKRLTINQLDKNNNTNHNINLLESDEDEEEELREILEQVGIIYGQENQEIDEQEDIKFQKSNTSKNNTFNNNKNQGLNNNNNNNNSQKNNQTNYSNKENIDYEQQQINNSDKKNNLKKEQKINIEQENNIENDNDDDNNQNDNEDEYDPDEDILRDEQNYQQQLSKNQKQSSDDVKDEIKSLKNQIEDMDNDLNDLKENIDRISGLMKALGDRNLGWMKEDHQDFLRIRSKYKNDMTSIKFIEECGIVIPVHSKEEIEDHIQQYSQYIAYDQEKKDTLKRYKDIKDAKTKLEEDLKQYKNKFHEELLIKRKLKKTKEEIMEERLKKKDVINIWKQNKISYRNGIVQQEIEEKRMLQNIDKEKRLREEKIRDERKLLIKQYQDQKEQERKKLKELEELKVSEKVKKKLSFTDLSRIKAKEEQMVRKKQIRIIEKKIQTREEGENIVRIQQLNKEKFSYVEPRLSEPTKAAERRITQKYDNQGVIDRFGPSADSFAGNVLGFGGKLKVPSWRQSNI